jgi:hypothetical protein
VVVNAAVVGLVPGGNVMNSKIFSPKTSAILSKIQPNMYTPTQAVSKIKQCFRTHESITRTGLKQALIEFFKEISSGKPFEVPDDATLSEVFQ